MNPTPSTPDATTGPEQVSETSHAERDTLLQVVEDSSHATASLAEKLVDLLAERDTLLQAIEDSISTLTGALRKTRS